MKKKIMMNLKVRKIDKEFDKALKAYRKHEITIEELGRIKDDVVEREIKVRNQYRV